MYRLLPLLGDIGLGILTILSVSHLFGREDLWGFIMLPFILLPDLDALVEIKKKGYTAASAENPIDHREFLHKPILWLVPLFLLWALTGFGFWGALAFALILLHFLHDSVLTGWGVPWLSPWNKVRIKFFATDDNRESLHPRDLVRMWDTNALRERIVAYGNENWIRDVYLRPTPPAIIEYVIFGVAILLLTLSLFV